MDEKLLKIEKLKASIEKHKAYIIYWQTKILSRVDKSDRAHNSLYIHAKYIDDCAEEILRIK